MKAAAQTNRGMRGTVYMVTAGVFVVDAFLPNGVASGMLYVIPVLLTLWLPPHACTLNSALASTSLTIVGFFLSPSGALVGIGITNRILALCTMWVTAVLVLKRKRAEEALRASEEYYRDLFENANDALATFTVDGVVTSFNRGAERMLGWSREEMVGQPYQKFYTPTSAAHAEESTRRFLAGERVPSIFEIEQVRKDGRVLVAEVRTRPLYDKAGVLIGFQGIQRDITAHKQAEAALGKEQAYVELLQAIAVAANQATTIEDAIQTCLDRVCAVTTWPVGHLYLHAQETPDELVPTPLWHLDDPARFEAFRQVTEGTRLAFGKGLPGRVLASGKPAWIVDVAQDPNFPRAQMVTDLGVKAGFAFPILAGVEVVGVLEFFSTEALEPDEPLLKVMEPIGIQLGRVIERQRAEDALRRSELRFRSVTESANDAIIVADSRGNITYWNKGARTIFGYREEEVMDQPLTLLMAERYRDAHRKGLERVRSTGESRVIGATVELHGLKKDGNEFPLELSLATWQIGEETFYSGIIRDITARKQAEEALQEAHAELDRRVQERTVELSQTNAALHQEITNGLRMEEALRHERNLLAVTLTSIGDAVIATDATATLTFINPVAETLTGWPQHEALGQPLEAVFRIVNEQTRQAVENPATRVLREGVVVGLANHTILRARDGREVPIADSGAPISGKDGQVQGVVLVFRDVTESRQAAAAMLQAKEAAEAADRAKSEFLATMSHELRTPIHVILGYTDLLLEKEFGSLMAAQVETLRRIELNARVLFELLSMVLDLNRLEIGRLPVDRKAVEVAELLTEVQAETQWMRDHSGLAFIWEVKRSLPVIHTDPGKLKVVLKNLLSNAIKYTRQGTVMVVAQEQQGGIEISVTDTGIGIPAPQREAIFEAFRQLDPVGTQGAGLGLYIVRRLVELLDGQVTVESEVGKGSTFRVWVPSGHAG